MPEGVAQRLTELLEAADQIAAEHRRVHVELDGSRHVFARCSAIRPRSFRGDKAAAFALVLSIQAIAGSPLGCRVKATPIARG